MSITLTDIRNGEALYQAYRGAQQKLEKLRAQAEALKAKVSATESDWKEFVGTYPTVRKVVENRVQELLDLGVIEFSDEAIASSAPANSKTPTTVKSDASASMAAESAAAVASTDEAAATSTTAPDSIKSSPPTPAPIAPNLTPVAATDSASESTSTSAPDSTSTKPKRTYRRRTTPPDGAKTGKTGKTGKTKAADPSATPDASASVSLPVAKADAVADAGADAVVVADVVVADAKVADSGADVVVVADVDAAADAVTEVADAGAEVVFVADAVPDAAAEIADAGAEVVFVADAAAADAVTEVADSGAEVVADAAADAVVVADAGAEVTDAGAKAGAGPIKKTGRPVALPLEQIKLPAGVKPPERPVGITLKEEEYKARWARGFMSGYSMGLRGEEHIVPKRQGANRDGHIAGFEFGHKAGSADRKNTPATANTTTETDDENEEWYWRRPENQVQAGESLSSTYAMTSDLGPVTPEQMQEANAELAREPEPAEPTTAEQYGDSGKIMVDLGPENLISPKWLNVKTEGPYSQEGIDF